MNRLLLLIMCCAGCAAHDLGYIQVELHEHAAGTYELIAIDLWVMLGLTVLLVPFLVSGLRLGRREGAVLLVLYLGYVGYLYVR